MTNEVEGTGILYGGAKLGIRTLTMDVEKEFY